MRTTRFAGVLAIAAMLSLTGCSAIGDLLKDDSPVRDGESNEITEGGDLDVFTLKVGDCFNDMDATEVTELPVVPCDEPHDNEVYFEYAVPDGDYPGDTELDASAQESCEAQFDAFIGMAYADSAFGYSYLIPTQGSWEENGDRLIQCFVYEPSAQVTGTLAGAAL